MIRINLIPYRMARQQQQIKRHVSNFIGIIVLASVLSLGMHTIASLELADLKKQTAQLTAQNQALQEKIGKIKDLDALRTEVERKLKIVDTLQEGRFRSLKTLHEVAQLIPKNVWLTSIKNKTDAIALEGLAESNKTIANFMRVLDKSSLFFNVKLQGISRVEIDGRPVRKFSLNVGRTAKPSATAVHDVKVRGRKAP